MIKGIKRFVYLFGVLGFLVFGSLFASYPVMAVGTVDVPASVEKKMILQNVYQCYWQGAFRQRIDSLGAVYDQKGDFLLNSSGNAVLVSKMKNGKYTTSEEATYSCRDFVVGNGSSINSVFSATGIGLPDSSSTDDVIKFMEGMGYTVKEEKTASCYNLSYTATSIISGAYGNNTVWDGKTNNVCINNDNTVRVDNSGDGEMDFYIKGDGQTEQVCFKPFAFGESCINGSEFTSGSNKASIMMNLIEESCGGGNVCVKNYGAGSVEYEFNRASSSSAEQNSLNNYSVAFGARNSAGMVAVRTLSAGSISDASGFKIKNDDPGKRQLYQNYYTQFYGMKAPDCTLGDDGALGSMVAINWLDGGTMKKCYYSSNDVSNNSNRNKKVNGINDNGFFVSGSLDLNGLIDAINQLPTEYDDITAADVNTSEATSEDSCLAADLNGQGWFLCSALSNSTYAATFLDNVIDDWLRVDTQYYDGNSSTYKIWEVMRGIANIIMIILLLVIIVSQLSGFGINNYGIKKMLPRFIVMAILINLSFVICDVAVDFSNLMGVGLRNLFGSIGQNIEAQGTTDYIAILVTSLLSVVGIGGAASSSITTIIPFIIGAGAVEAPIIVLVVLLALIPVIIGLAIFFMMLSGRFIIIVGCIALSPIAFTLFILPNTQGVFKKWWGLFKAALIMYPLCGAVIGISYLVRGFVMTDGDKQIWMGVIAMIAPYLPFFMLPSLLKSTIGMLGTAGNALMSLGDKVKTGAKDGMDAIRHTGAYQDASKAALEKMNVQRAQNTIKKLGKLKKDEMSESQKRRLFDAQQTVSAGRMADAQRGLGAYVVTQDEAERRAAAAKDAQELKSYTERNDDMTHSQLNDELKGATEAYKNDKNDTNRIRLQAAIMSANNRGMNRELLDELKHLKLTADIGNDAKVLGQLATSNDIVLQQFGKQMSKPLDSNGTLPSRKSLGEFVSGGGDVSLQGALDRIGKNALVGANDDTLKFIKDSAGSSATIDMLVTAGVNASSMKEVSVINEMLGTKVAESGARISIDGKQLVGLDPSTVEAIVDNGNEYIKQSLLKAFERVKSSPELMSQMNPQTIKSLGGVAHGGGSGPTLYNANGRPLPSSGKKY